MRMRMLLIFLLTLFGSTGALAQGTVFTARPSARPDTCTQLTLGISCGAQQGGMLAWMSDSDGSEADGDCKIGPTGSTKVLCFYDTGVVPSRWRPVGGLSGGGSGSLSLPSDFCIGKLNGGKLTWNGTSLECDDDTASSAGSGHTIRSAGISLPSQVGLNFTGRGAVVSDDPSTGNTQVNVPAYTVRVQMASGQFSGTVTCPSEPPTSGTMSNCTARVTQLGGQTFSSGGYLDLSGTYNVSAPNTTTNGFHIEEGVFTGAGCGIAVGKCGLAFNNFQNSLAIVAASYNPTSPGSGNGKKIRFLGQTYPVDPANPFYLFGYGWTLDGTAGPDFNCSINPTTATRTLPGTGTVNAAATARILTMSSSICNGGNCRDSAVLARPGDRILFGTNWETDPVAVLKAFSSDGLTLQFVPARTTNYSGPIQIGFGKIWQFDNQSQTFHDYPNDLFGSVQLIGGQNMKVTAQNFCLAVNPNAPSPRTSGAGYRVVPLQFIVQNSSWMENDMEMGGPACGRNDSGWTTTNANGNGASSSAGAYYGHATGCFSYEDSQEQIQGNDPNTNADDGVGAIFTTLSSGVRIKNRGLLGNIGRGVFSGGISLFHLDAMNFEGVHQLVWFTEGGQDIEIDGLSQEQWTHCSDTIPGFPHCDAVGTRRPFIDVGQWMGPATEGNAGYPDLASYKINFSKIFFDQNPRTFLKIVSTTPARVELNGSVDGTSKLLDVTSNTVSVFGNINCREQFGVSTACDLPGSGMFKDLVVSSYDGTVHANGRDLSDMAGRLPFAKETDDDVHTAGTYCKVNGGPGTGGSNESHYALCPGGGTTALSGLSTDVTISSPNAGQELAYDGSRWRNTAAPFTEDSTGFALGPIIYPTNNITDTFILGLPTLPTVALSPFGPFVFNENGLATNFRVESDTNANMLFVDGTNNRVGIGTGSPSVPLEVNGAAKVTSLSLTGAGSVGQLLFTEGSPSGWTCGSGEYWIRANNSTHRLQKCDNSLITDVGSATTTVSQLNGDSGSATPSANIITIAGGAGITSSATSATVTLATNSLETGFITDANASAISCAGAGRMQVNDDGSLRYCDGVNSSQKATFQGLSWTQNQIIVANSSSNSDLIGRSPTINSAGDLAIPGGNLTVTGDDPAATQLLVKAAASQSGNVLDLQNSSGSSLMALDPSGNLTIAGTFSSLCAGTNDCFFDLPGNTSNFAAPGTHLGRIGMVNDVMVARLNSETAPSRILRDVDMDFTLNRILLGAGNDTLPTVLGSLGTTTTLLHGNASGAPTFGAVSLTADVSGNLPVTNLNSGTSASVTTFWRGDGTWATPAGGGTVTSVGLSVPGSSIFGATGTPVTGSGTLGLTTTGTSGGIPYFSSSSVLSSSAALTANQIVLGGGAGTTPASLGSLGTTVTVLHGNAAGAPTFGAVSLTADVSGTLPVANGGTGFTSGTSGGIPFFLNSGTLSSSAALTANQLVIGGGAGVTPTALGSLGTTTTLLHGNASGAPTFGAVSLTADVSGALPVANGGTALTALGTANQVLRVNAAASALVYEPGGATIFNFRSAATATAGSCFSLASIAAATGVTSTTCDTANTDWYAPANMTITGFSLAIRKGATSPATTNGCDIALQVNGVAQGSDSPDYIDWGATTLDGPGEVQFVTESISLSAGDRLELVFVTDGSGTQCPSASGCSCAGTVDGIVTIWGKMR